MTTQLSPKNCTCAWELFGNHNHNTLCPIHGDICQNRHRGAENSVKANRHVDKARNEKIVLGAITELGEASSEMVETHLGWSHQSVSSRFSDLKRKGLIVRASVCKTKSGCTAAKYREAGK